MVQWHQSVYTAAATATTSSLVSFLTATGVVTDLARPLVCRQPCSRKAFMALGSCFRIACYQQGLRRTHLLPHVTWRMRAKKREAVLDANCLALRDVVLLNGGHEIPEIVRGTGIIASKSHELGSATTTRIPTSSPTESASISSLRE